jgi:ankyrin repeat protein
MRAMLPVSVIDIRGPALEETTTSMLKYFTLIVYLISNKMLGISEDLFVLLEIALARRPFLSLLLKKTPTTRAFVQQLFQSAIGFRKTKIVSILVDAKLVFDAWVLQPGFPLELAISKRDTALSKCLVRAGADITDDRGSKALAIAAKKGNLELVSFLIEMGANPNPQDTSTCYPALLEATSRDDKEMVRVLLNCGADINASSSRESCVSPLVSAAENGDLQLVQLLLDRGVHTEDRCLRRQTALGIAAYQGHSELARKLLDAGAAVHTPVFNVDHRLAYTHSSALCEAVAEDHQSVVEVLLTHKADPNTRKYHLDHSDTAGRTALHIAVTNENERIVQLLLNAGARVNELNFHDADLDHKCRKETALHQAVRFSNTGMVQILLNAGSIAFSSFSEVQLRSGSQYQDNFSYNTADLLVQYPNIEIAGLLCTADPSAIFKYGTYFFQSAIQSNDIDLARDLLNAGVDVNGVRIGSFRETVLQHAVSTGNFKLAKVLLGCGANVNAPPGGKYSRTALQTAVDKGSMELVQMLLDHGANVNAPPSKYCRTALQSAVNKGSMELVQVLLSHGADIHAPGTMPYGTALQSAAKAGHVEVVKLLLYFTDVRDSSANASDHYSDSDNATNDWKSAMLPAAAKGGLFEIVRLLLAEGADINTVPPGTHYGTALQEAVGQQNLMIVHLLLDNDADPNIPGPVWDKLLTEWRTGTALQAAVDVKNLGLIHILLEAGSRADVLSSAYEDRRTPLEAALEAALKDFEGEDSMMLVQLLLAAGADVNLTGFHGHYLEYGGEIYFVFERTMLSAAIHSGNVQLVRMLLEAGANVNAVSTYKHNTNGYSRQKSPLQDAVALADLEMSKILLEAGADVRVDSPFPYRSRSLFGCHKAGMLSVSILGGNIELSQLLLDSGVNINLSSPTEESITALVAAVDMGHISIMETLLKRGAEVDGNVYSRGGTALKRAATNGYAGVAFALLEAGADPTLAHPDGGRSPLVGAAARGRIDMVQMFLNTIKSRGTSGQLFIELLESSLEMALEDTYGEYNIAIGMIKTEIEDSKSA